MFRKKVRFYSEELLSPRPAPKLEDKILSAVCDSLCIAFEPTVHIWGHSSNRNLRTCHGVVTGTHCFCRLSTFNWKSGININFLFWIVSNTVFVCLLHLIRDVRYIIRATYSVASRSHHQNQVQHHRWYMPGLYWRQACVVTIGIWCHVV